MMLLGGGVNPYNQMIYQIDSPTNWSGPNVAMEIGGYPKGMRKPLETTILVGKRNPSSMVVEMVPLKGGR